MRVASRSIDLITEPDGDIIPKPAKNNGKRDYILMMTSRRAVNRQQLRTR